MLQRGPIGNPARPRYVNPVPGGTVGRTDQGVDISAAPGTPVYAIADETLVGEIPNWYKGQPLYWFRQAGTNIYNYVAEQFRPKLAIGQSVKAGQEVGTVAPSGTGLELGFATASGQTLASATTGYTEGQVTPAGTQYLNQVIGGRARPGGGPAQPVSGGGGVDPILQAYTSLRDMPRTAPPGTKNPMKWFMSSFTGKWDGLAASTGGGGGSTPVGGAAAGVPPAYQQWVASASAATGLPQAVVAEQIRKESKFNPRVTSPTGAQGLAQIEPPTWKMLGIPGSPYDPNAALQGYTKYMNQLLSRFNGNVKNALAAYNAGPGNIAAGMGYADAILAAAGVA